MHFSKLNRNFAHSDGIQLVSITHDFKFQAPDGKQRFADALDSYCVQTLAENYPNNRARSFLHWFTYSDNGSPIITCVSLLIAFKQKPRRTLFDVCSSVGTLCQVLCLCL